MLTRNFLHVGEKGITAADWVTEKTEEVGQPIYYKDVLTLEWKPAIALRKGSGFVYNIVMHLQGMKKYGYQ